MIILFDLDDTLIDDAAATVAARRSYWAQHCSALGDFDVFAQKWDALLRSSYKAFVRGEVDLPGARRLTYSELLGVPGLSLDESHARHSDFMQAYRPQWRLFADVLPALSTLQACGFAMGVVSNGQYDVQSEKLERLGIARYFGLLLTSYQLGHGKPEPQIFESAANYFGVEPKDALFVGDSLKNDVQGSRNAGMQAVWLNRTGQRNESDVREIRTLAELPAVAC